jgi:5-methylcytosine-specific restriction protein A
MKEKVNKAFVDFDKGIRPDGYKPPRGWYVLNAKGSAYPAKGIWALANGDKPGNFNTRDARIALANLDYSLLNTRVSFEEDDFETEVERAKSDTSQNRAKRLKTAPKKPQLVYTLRKDFKRNPDVVAEVLLRANGICGRCEKPAPFKSRKNSSPYLEVHHIKQLADGGNDTIKNAIALCPNCHRESHFG